MESWKDLKKVTENRKSQKSSAESQKKHMCQKPENAIFMSRKPGKIGKYGRNWKTQFKICGNWISPFGSCGKPEKLNKTMKNRGNRKIRKKSHGKLEKVGISYRKPETDPLFPALIKHKRVKVPQSSKIAGLC